MIARYQMNVKSFDTGTTNTYITIPFIMENQLVDNSDLVNKDFVDVEVKKAINPIDDYEKVRFLPLNNINVPIDKLIYNVVLLSGNTLLNPTNYGNVGFNNDDIKYQRSNFKESFVYLKFYDSDNVLNQNLITDLTLFSRLHDYDLLQISNSTGVIGQPKAAIDIPVRFTLSNPLKNQRGYYEGYHLYDYKSGYSLGVSKFLYMRAAFNNSKTGRSINLMTDPTAYTIDTLVKKLYTRYVLVRTNTGFYYEIDNTYSTNVSYIGSDVSISLYQIQTL